MIDIETLSTHPNAFILTIGAVKFSRTGKLKPLNKMVTFYRRILPNSCKRLKLHIDSDTQEWWSKQSQEARYEAFDHPDRVKLSDALNELCEWIGTDEIIWANSPNFDLTILENAMSKCNIIVPWRFWNTRDVRTAVDLGSVNKDLIITPGADHTALADCYKQIIAVKQACKHRK